ncbi:hypothetical protein RO07_25350 [Pandoraea pulmonicola]|uniref:Uncharacterized protein n=1 Tax=Pandoraea pulmonicola TaxID=93221 RepID=A0AAJ5CYW8_PANPU|nr:hypothetical protein RO07_25350 [Pandoraea pulmonicola]SUA88958.1 Uncharacterised protein [Pandoraea pulmonicola]
MAMASPYNRGRPRTLTATSYGAGRCGPVQFAGMNRCPASSNFIPTETLLSKLYPRAVRAMCATLLLGAFAVSAFAAHP